MVYAYVWTYAKPVCAVPVSSTSEIVFTRLLEQSHHSQWMNDRPVFKSQFHMEDPGHGKPVFIVPNNNVRGNFI